MALYDSTEAGKAASMAAIDSYYSEALDPNSGEFLLQVVGVLGEAYAVG
jgi:hypothetical protein